LRVITNKTEENKKEEEGPNTIAFQYSDIRNMKEKKKKRRDQKGKKSRVMC
jgi:hypothetical protein